MTDVKRNRMRLVYDPINAMKWRLLTPDGNEVIGIRSINVHGGSSDDERLPRVTVELVMVDIEQAETIETTTLHSKIKQETDGR